MSLISVRDIGKLSKAFSLNTLAIFDSLFSNDSFLLISTSPKLISAPCSASLEYNLNTSTLDLSSEFSSVLLICSLFSSSSSTTVSSFAPSLFEFDYSTTT